MNSQIYGTLTLFYFFFFIFYLNPPAAINVATQINSNSVLVALLDSHYTELSELVEKALLLQTLEKTVENHNITIFAPSNEVIQRNLDPEFKRFLLEPGNLKSLQNFVLLNIIPFRVGSGRVRVSNPDQLVSTKHYCGEKILGFELVKTTRPDDFIRPDGLIHGIDRLLVPRVVEEEFNRRSLTSISAVLPEGAPVLDPRKPLVRTSGEPVVPVYDAMAPGPSLAPTPAPGPEGHIIISTVKLRCVKEKSLADILVNLTSLATEMGKLVSVGYVLTVLAPNDVAVAKLTTNQLSDPGAPERIVYYHIIPEYQTEESMYNSVRRFGKVEYDTLRELEKVVAEEADGPVKFGSGEESGYLFDPDIYTDGRISVQGIDGVLFPVEKKAGNGGSSLPAAAAKVVAKQNRGKLLEVACSVVGAFGQDFQFTSCY